MAEKVLLFDQFSQPIELPKKVEAQSQSGVAERIDRTSTSALREIDPEMYARILRDTASFPEKQRLCDRVYYNAHFFSIGSDRASTITGYEWEVQPFTDAPGAKAKPEDVKVAESIAELLNGTENLGAYFEHLAWGELYFVSAAEMIIDPSSYRPVMFELVDGERFNWWKRQVTLLTDASPREGEQLRPGMWTVHGLNLRNPNKARLARALAFWHMLTSLAVVDYADLSAKYGKPIPIGYFTDPTQREALLDALIQIGEDFVGAFPKDTKVDLVQAIAQTSDVQRGLTQLGYDQSTKAACGNSLIVDAKPGSGTLAGNGAQLTNQKVARGVANRVAASVRVGPIRTLAWYHHGPKTIGRLPLLVFKARAIAEEEAKARSYVGWNAALAFTGLTIDPEHIRETAGVPKLVPRVVPGMAPASAGEAETKNAPPAQPVDGQPAPTSDAGVATTMAITGVALSNVREILLDVAAGTIDRGAAIVLIKGAGFSIDDATTMVDAQIAGAKPVEQPAPAAPPAAAPAQQRMRPAAQAADREPKVRTVMDVIATSALLDEQLQRERASQIMSLAQKAVDDGISVAAFRDQLWEMAEQLDTSQSAELLTQSLTVADAIATADVAERAGK